MQSCKHLLSNVGSSIGTLAKRNTCDSDENLPARETAYRQPRGVGSWTSIFPGRGPPIGRRWRCRCGERRAGTQRAWPSLRRRKAKKWSDERADELTKDRLEDPFRFAFALLGKSRRAEAKIPIGARPTKTLQAKQDEDHHYPPGDCIGSTLGRGVRWKRGA